MTDYKVLYGDMYVEEPLRLSTVVDEAVDEGLLLLMGLRVVENERLSNGVCRLKVARFGEDVDVDQLKRLIVNIIGKEILFSTWVWNDGEVWPIEEPEKPKEAEALMFYAYLVWRSADE